MGIGAVSGRAARIDWSGAGFALPEQMGWSISAAGRVVDKSSGDDTAKVVEADLWQECTGSVRTLLSEEEDPVPSSTTIPNAIFLYQQKFTVDVSATGLADTVTVNDVVFTQAAATSVADREWLNAAGLVLCINSRTYGAPKARATSAAEVVTIKGYGGVLTVVDADVGGVVATTDNTKSVTGDIVVMDYTLEPVQNEAGTTEITYNLECNEMLHSNGNRM